MRQKTHPMTPREVELKAQLEQCQEALAAAQRENVLLRQKLDALARRFFGVSSESLNPAQLQLLLSLPELSAQSTATPALPAVVPERAPKPAKRARAPRLPEHLPVIEEVIDPEPVKAAGALALHRTGSERATRLRTRPLSPPAHRAAQIRASHRA